MDYVRRMDLGTLDWYMLSMLGIHDHKRILVLELVIPRNILQMDRQHSQLDKYKWHDGFQCDTRLFDHMDFRLYMDLRKLYSDNSPLGYSRHLKHSQHL